jgi:hypothetical protein
MQLCPGEAGGDIDRRVLPDDAFRALQTADAEAVHPDELAGLLRRDVTPWGR